MEPEETEKPSPRRYLWTIVTFVTSLVLLISSLRDAKTWVLTVDQGLLDSLQRVDTWGLLQAYAQAYGQSVQHACSAAGSAGCVFVVAVADFLPITVTVTRQAMSQGFWASLWVVSGVAAACLITYQGLRAEREPNWLSAPLWVLGYIVVESLLAWMVKLVLAAALTTVGFLFQLIGLLVVPAVVVNYFEKGHTILSFVESTKSLRGLTRHALDKEGP